MNFNSILFRFSVTNLFQPGCHLRKWYFNMAQPVTYLLFQNKTFKYFLFSIAISIMLRHVWHTIFVKSSVNTARKLNYMKLQRMRKKWKINRRLFQQTNKQKKMNTARECGFLTCDMLILKRFVALQIVVPLETNQFKEHCKDFKN